MKKIVSLILCVALLASACVLTGCTEKTLKFGSAVYVSGLAATDASADKNGAGDVCVTVAAITVDANGKIVACALDTMQTVVEYTVKGKAVGNPEFQTKYEKGDNYNMVAYGGAVQEWYKQADAFEGVVAGKTLDEVKALVVEGKGNDEVVNAGCTIYVSDFVSAIEKAYNNAAESAVTEAASLKVTAYAAQTIEDATADKDGSNEVEIYTFAAAVNAEGKVITANSDCVPVSFTFNRKGKATLDTTKAIASKREQGANYGMVAYGGAAKEWFEQADAFDTLCEGKTGAEIKGLMNTAGDSAGKGVEEVVNAGCTIYVSGLVAAASKI